MSYTAGNYNATWNALALGLTDTGIIWEITHKGEILRFEEFGENIIDLCQRGADVTVEFVLKQWLAAGLQSVLWPYSTFGKIACTGEFAVRNGYAKPLVLTAESCSPAGTDGPVTITFHKTVIAPDVAVQINLDNKPRMVPIRMICFLTDVGTPPTTDWQYFSIT